MQKLGFLFSIFLSFRVVCSLHEAYDVETLPTLRTKQYSIDPYKKIVVFSELKTGSSLVYNVFRFLFENQETLHHHHFEPASSYFVLKTHGNLPPDTFQDKDALFIVPIRNPIQRALSVYRTFSRPIKDIELSCKRMIHRQKNHLDFVEQMQANDLQVLLLKYEDFENNIDYIFRCIETAFSIHISDEDKVTMQNGYNKENVSRCTQDLVDRSNFLPISGFHGKQIAPEGYAPPEEVLYWLHHYTQQYSSIFKKYGY